MSPLSPSLSLFLCLPAYLCFHNLFLLLHFLSFDVFVLVTFSLSLSFLCFSFLLISLYSPTLFLFLAFYLTSYSFSSSYHLLFSFTTFLVFTLSLTRLLTHVSPLSLSLSRFLFLKHTHIFYIVPISLCITVCM